MGHYIDVGDEMPQTQGAPRYERAQRRGSRQGNKAEFEKRIADKEARKSAPVSQIKVGISNPRGSGFKGSGLANSFKSF